MDDFKLFQNFEVPTIYYFPKKQLPVIQTNELKHYNQSLL